MSYKTIKDDLDMLRNSLITVHTTTLTNYQNLLDHLNNDENHYQAVVLLHFLIQETKLTIKKLEK